MEFELVHSDILDVNVDCLVSPLGDNMSMSGGVAEDIKAACGGPIHAGVQRYDTPTEGSVLVTDGYDLADYILHTVTTPQENRRGLNVRTAAREALSMADRLGCHSIAFPSVGSGFGGLQSTTPIKIIGETVEAHEATTLAKAKFVCKNESTYESALTIYNQDGTPWVERTA